MWVTILYHLTGKSISGEHLKEELFVLVRKSHDTGLFVRVFVCDMGNGPLFKELRIDSGPGMLVNFVQHPVVPTEKLFITPDIVHVFKNVVIMTGQHKKVFIRQSLVEAFNLPTSVADFEHIVFVQEYQNGMSWRLAPNLRATDLIGGHFRKMKLNNAVNVFNLNTVAALKLLASILNRPELLTTAFFVQLVYTWFKYMTARTPSLALGKKNLEAYEGAPETLSTTMYMFEHLHFGSEGGAWKPCQSGVKLSTMT